MVTASAGDTAVSGSPSFTRGGQMYELRRVLTDSAAPGLHTLTGYVKTSITSHYPLIIGIDQALTRVSTYANWQRGPGAYKSRGPVLEPLQHTRSDIWWINRSLSSTANMVKYFSVDWLAQSHHSAEEHGADVDTAPTCRPHIPCMVQPRPPTFGKGYLQPKPKPSKPVEHTEPMESGGHYQDSNQCSPLRSSSCASPISEISGYSSGYESEAASSECLSVNEGSEVEKDGPQRRVRTKFSPEQISKLEKIFNKHKYLEVGERVKTAQKLNLTETQVRTWFQNRRMKLKREVQNYFAPHVQPVPFQPLAPVQYHGVAGQRPQYAGSAPTFYQLPVPQLVLQQQMPPHHPPHLMIHHPHFY
ncbi:homeobox protein vent1-like [Mugil cephalus]|uniref:homeobox protein vent1-like n=1 Tax=Mugil cephalus TaxID=48193 RepID=UPI001FB7FA29|nr:homeobox protein vent1-like [Mugil cephalus]